MQAGAPILVVKELLGHQDISTTMRYAHLAPTGLRLAMELLVPGRKEPKERPQK